MSYFDNGHISNSDLKSFRKQQGLMREDPANLQAIFDFGSYFHATILEPHRLASIKAESESLTEEDIKLAERMRDRYWQDPMCRQFSMADDFQREKEFYPKDVQVGPYLVDLRCKMDGARVRVKICMELKGLGVESEKAFKEALIRFDYDQGVAHYLLSTGYEHALIVGISKKDPRKLFKWICRKHDDFYLGGEQKIIDTLTLLREFSEEDVRLAA